MRIIDDTGPARLPRAGVVHGHGSSITLRDLLRAAKGLCHPVLLCRRTVVEAYPALAEAAAAAGVELVESEDLVDAATGLALDGVTTFDDTELEATDRILAKLGLPGLSQPAEAFAGIDTTPSNAWDKLFQRSIFMQEGIGAVRGTGVSAPSDFRSAVALLGLPGVLKRRRGAGGIGMTFLYAPDDVERELDSRTDWSELLYEQYIANDKHPSGVEYLGDYVSVETISTSDAHVHFAIFDKLPLARSLHKLHPGKYSVFETGNVFPSLLPASIRETVLSATGKALDRLGVRWRVTHTELRVSGQGAEIIEVNGRLGGEVARLLRIAGLPDIVRCALALSLGYEPTWSPAVPECYVAAVDVPFPELDGTVRSNVHREQLARSAATVVEIEQLARMGQPVTQLICRTSNIALRSPNRAELESGLLATLDSISHLFAADGLDTDPWLSTRRSQLRKWIAKSEDCSERNGLAR